MEISTPLMLLGTFLFTYFGVRWFRAWSLKKGVLDHPNERSSHTIPTPRGGGLVIAIAVILGYLLASYTNSYPVGIGYIAGSLLIVIVSLIDDIYSLPSLVRLAIHFASAAIAVYVFGGFSSLALPGDGVIQLNNFTSIFVSLLWIVWLTNAYNFMDGIDGIAGVQGVTAGLGWFAITSASDDTQSAFLAGSIAFACFAFLLHNWQPARIFMGDAGSAFLGYSFAVLPLIFQQNAGSANGSIPWLAVAMVWPFLFDSIFTFIRRLLNREKVWAAHRSHLYQRMVIHGWQHRSVSRLYFFLGACLSVAIYLAFVNGKVFFTITIASIMAASVIILLCAYWAERTSLAND